MTLTAPIDRRAGTSLPARATALAAFSTAALGAGLGRALVTTYLPVLLERIRDAPGLIGTVMLVNAAAGFFVPLWIGIWSDRLARGGHSRVFPFVLGGSIVTALGLLAIAIGSGTSYLALALFALVAYIGLNSVTTSHRALIPELFGKSRRAKATGAEEFAMLLGGLAGVVAGGVLVEFAGWAPFAFGALAVPLLAVPTVARLRGIRPQPVKETSPRPPIRHLISIASRPGVRAILGAQALWVLGYLGLPPFFILYADRVLGLTPSTAGIVLAAFGVATGVTMLGAGTADVRTHIPLLMLGVVFMVAGLASVAPASSLSLAVPGLAAAAVGFGVVSTLGFPVLTRYIPVGEEGAYTALYFAVRAIAAAVAVPAAGWTVAATGSYRALVLFGASATALALVPLVALAHADADADHLPFRWARLSWYTRWVAAVIGLFLAATGVGLLSIHTALSRVDEWLFGALQGGSVGQGILSALLDELAFANYLALTLIALCAALRRGKLLATALLVSASGLLAWAIVRGVWAIVERDRPEELLATPTVHSWAHVSSFPSGHVAVTVALVVATTLLFPKLRVVLWSYAALLSVSRIVFGAHFPTDILVGAAIGMGSAVLMSWMLAKHGVRLSMERWPWTERHFWPGSQTRARARQVGLALGAAVVITFFTLAQTVGIPQNPDGSLLDPAIQVDLQHALLDVAGLAVVVALARVFIGGALLVGAAVLLGVLATIEYDPLVALVAFLAFLVPGALLLMSGVRTRHTALAVAAVVTGIVAFGGVAAQQVHAYFTGPTHPQSTVRIPPAQDVDWVWAGAVTPTSFDVKARLRTEGVVRLRTWSGDGTDARFVLPEKIGDDLAWFTVEGLRPATEYRYALEVDGTLDRARRGRVRTFAQGPASFSFAFSSCARVGSNGQVFDSIRHARPLFFLAVGDLFYGNVSNDDTGAFRSLYGSLLEQPAPSLLFRSTAVAYTWDDHDFGPDGANRLAASAPAAEQAYRELVPHYSLPGGMNEGPIYQAFDVGRIRFLVTDTRSQRDPQARRDNESKTMLGAEQKAWLKRELLTARDRYALVIWVNPDPWIGPAAEGADGWAGYATERRELSDFIAANAIRNILMLSGDAHMLAIDDGSHSNYSEHGNASFPVMHAAALDRHGGIKGGPYSEGAFPGSGQYGVVQIDDDGTSVGVTLVGRNYSGEEIVRYAFSVPADTR